VSNNPRQVRAWIIVRRLSRRVVKTYRQLVGSLREPISADEIDQAMQDDCDEKKRGGTPPAAAE
jgi:hypothetical protein